MIADFKPIALSRLAEKPIHFSYIKPSAEKVKALEQGNKIIEIQPQEGLRILNSYYQAKHEGAFEKVFTRVALLERLQRVALCLAPHHSLLIFDGFRTIKTQAVIFELFYQKLKLNHPQLNRDELEQLTRRYVSHPTDKNHFAVPLHNTGGAIDLAIYSNETQRQWYFGTAFDEASELSATDFFEQPYDPRWQINEQRWYKARENRRILFHLMKEEGFTNYRNEWWHFDLGNCMWSKELGIPWIYDSMEADYDKMINQYPSFI